MTSRDGDARAPRQVRMFTTPIQIAFSAKTRNATHGPRARRRRPAGPALSTIGKVFWTEGIELQTAKIMTVGERAEDVFYDHG